MYDPEQAQRRYSEVRQIGFHGNRADNSAKRRPFRAVLACNSCRALRTKCDEARPSCSMCRDRDIVCSYSEPTRKKSVVSPQAPSDMQTRLIESMTSLFSSLNSRIEARIADFTTSTCARMDTLERLVDLEFSTGVENNFTGSLHATIGSSLEFSTTSSQSFPREIEDKSRVFPDADVPPHVSSAISLIPMRHTTGQANLLNVEALSALTSDWFEAHGIQQRFFPKKQEQARRRLGAYRRERGIRQSSSQQSSDFASGSFGTTEPFVGQGGISHGKITVNKDTQLKETIDLGPQTIARLADLYMIHFNSMHPILTPARMKWLVDNFSSSMARPQRNHSAPAVVGSTTYSHSQANMSGSPQLKKRKRTEEWPQSKVRNETSTQNTSFLPSYPDHSIDSGIVLLMMALGRACEHDENLSDFSQAPGAEQSGQMGQHFGSSQTLKQGTAIAGPASASAPIPDATGSESNGSRHESAEHTPEVEDRTSTSYIKSLSVAGLEYFALASEIIDKHWGENSLSHVHLNILAGIFLGNAGYIWDSYGYIVEASRGLQTLLKPELDRLVGYQNRLERIPADDNPLIFAFWTCLQLESDVIAELDFPRSGILQYEEFMPGPNLEAAENINGLSSKVIHYYSAQMCLRKHLNQLHYLFYQTDHVTVNWKKHITQVAAAEENLAELLNTLPAWIKWPEEALPVEDLLAARLRAKVYGAQVITYRKCLLKGLDLGKSDEFEDSDEDMMSVSEAEKLRSAIRIYAGKGINALIRSTSAFYGVVDPTREKLLVTNLWGTAHAQWGNVLTLLAAFNSTSLRPLVDENILKILYTTTLGFLDFNAHDGSALRIDHDLLCHVGKQVNVDSPQAFDGNESFHTSQNLS